MLDNLWLGIPALVGLIGATSSMITGLTAGGQTKRPNGAQAPRSGLVSVNGPERDGIVVDRVDLRPRS